MLGWRAGGAWRPAALPTGASWTPRLLATASTRQLPCRCAAWRADSLLLLVGAAAEAAGRGRGHADAWDARCGLAARGPGGAGAHCCGCGVQGLMAPGVLPATQAELDSEAAEAERLLSQWGFTEEEQRLDG